MALKRVSHEKSEEKSGPDTHSQALPLNMSCCKLQPTTADRCLGPLVPQCSTAVPAHILWENDHMISCWWASFEASFGVMISMVFFVCQYYHLCCPDLLAISLQGWLAGWDPWLDVGYWTHAGMRCRDQPRLTTIAGWMWDGVTKSHWWNIRAVQRQGALDARVAVIPCVSWKGIHWNKLGIQCLQVPSCINDLWENSQCIQVHLD